MCQETAVTYELCMHEVSERRHCAAAQWEIDRAQKRATWCCFARTPSRRIVCQVKYQTYKDYSYCGRCKVLRSRERDRQVLAAQEEERRRAKADREARHRTVLAKLAQNKAKVKSEKALGVQCHEWQKVTPVKRGDRTAKQRHGNSFIENPLHAELLNHLTETGYREFMPPPDSGLRTGARSGGQHSRSQSQPPRNTRTATEHTRSRSKGPVLVPPQDPVSTGRVQHPTDRIPRGQPTATLPASFGRARPLLHIEVPKRLHSPVPQRQVAPFGGSRPKMVHDGGDPALARKPVPLRKDSRKHGPEDAYGEPMPDDDSLAFVEKYV